jgi:hypothetical protein
MSQGRDFRYNGYQMSQHKPGFSQGETELELLPVTAAERFTSDAAARKPVQPRGPKADTWSSQAKRWTPGFWRRFPVLGMLALLAVVIGAYPFSTQLSIPSIDATISRHNRSDCDPD